MVTTTTAATAAEYKSNISLDITLADAFDADYMDTEADDETERQRVNAAMAEYFGIN
jgi:hypothetical protein